MDLATLTAALIALFTAMTSAYVQHRKVLSDDTAASNTASISAQSQLINGLQDQVEQWREDTERLRRIREEDTKRFDARLRVLEKEVEECHRERDVLRELLDAV